jgi:sugar/nucleoside kinase (ribokinase family)
MIGRLGAENVDTTGMVIRPDITTALTVVLTQGNDRAILTAVGAMSTLTAGDVSANLLSRARHLHVSSYFLLERSLGPGLADLFEAAHRMGVTTSLDTNWDPAERWGDGQLRHVLASTDVLLPNEAEALGLTGASDLRDAVRALTAAGPRVVVKLGSRGALSADGSDCHEAGLPGALGSRLVDAIGAGDCCNAGVIAGLLRGMDLAAATGLGCAVGSASTRAVGGTGARTTMATALALAQTVAVTPFS